MATKDVNDLLLGQRKDGAAVSSGATKSVKVRKKP